MISQPAQGKGKNRGKHNSLKRISAQQSCKRYHPYIQQHQRSGHYCPRGTHQQHFLGTYASHNPATGKTSQHEQSQSAERKYYRSFASIHPVLFHHIVDKEAVDGNLTDLISKQGYQPENEKPVRPQSYLITSFVHLHTMFNLGQLDS